MRRGATSLWQVPPALRDVLYLTAVLNSCINPGIYGVYYFSERKAPHSREHNTPVL